MLIRFRNTQVHLVSPNDTIKVLKEMMFEWTGISIPHQKLLFGGTALEDLDKTLSEYNIYPDCTITVMRVRGGIENVGRERVGWKASMSELELDHFAYLLGKIGKMFSQNELPHREVLHRT